MKSKLYLIGCLVFALAFTSGCSLFDRKQKINRSTSASDKLSVPPSLTPQSRHNVVTNNTTMRMNRSAEKTAMVAPTTLKPNKSYYIIVGTYPNNDQALDAFVRMSSLGFTNTAMETRDTKQGNSLHMVRLGPFNNQDDIDKTKDTLSNAGVTQFKVVEN
jgi:cell division protein FtsN